MQSSTPETVVDYDGSPDSSIVDVASSNSQIDERTYSLNPHLRVVLCNDDEIIIKHGSRSNYSQVVSDEGETRLIGSVVRALRVPGTITELMERAGLSIDSTVAVGNLLDYLESRGVVVKASTSSITSYLDGVVGQGDELTSRIEQSTIAILGAGPLGAHVAMRMAEMRPGRLVLFDDRHVEGIGDDTSQAADAPPRQLASAIAERTGIEVSVAAGDLVDAWAGFGTTDLVLACYEQFSPYRFHAINEAAIERPTRWLLSYLDGSEGVIHPVAVPGESPCYYELEAQGESTLTRREDYHLYKDDVLEVATDFVASPLPAYVDVLGGMTVIAAVRHLTGLPPLAADQTVRIDFERLTFDYQQVLKLPRCPACSGLRPAHRHLFL